MIGWDPELMRRSFIISGILAVAVVVWIGSGQVGGKPSPSNDAPQQKKISEEIIPEVRVKTFRSAERVRELSLFGRTEAVRMVQMRAETKGRIIERAVKKGSTVKKGDVIVRLAMDDRRARLDGAQALVEQYRVAYVAAQQLSKKQFRSKVRLAEAKAQLETAKTQLAAVKLDIRRTVIHAPFGGVINKLPVNVGDYVEAKGELAELIDLDPILVVGQVTERDMGALKLGATAQIKVADGRERSGVIGFISKVGSAATRTFRVEVRVANPTGEVSEGLTTELRLPVQTVRAHLMSPSVLTLSETGAIGVKSLNPDNQVVFNAVGMVADTPEGIWLSGLPDEVVVITVGQEFVKIGQKVRPLTEIPK
jgi:membrane fusion protein, multidrug efflux system